MRGTASAGLCLKRSLLVTAKLSIRESQVIRICCQSKTEVKRTGKNPPSVCESGVLRIARMRVLPGFRDRKCHVVR